MFKLRVKKNNWLQIADILVVYDAVGEFKEVLNTYFKRRVESRNDWRCNC